MSGLFELDYFFTNLARFWPTFLAELTVIALVFRRTRSDSFRLGAGRRLKAAGTDTSGLWCLPFYLWAWQANRMVYGLFSDWETLDAAYRIHDEMEAIFAALFHLLVLRTIGMAITRDAPATLGLTGHPRTAVSAAILSVFLGMALMFRLGGY